MGKPEEQDTCVDKDFRVTGVQGLRVVDMSVAPLMSKWVLLLDSLMILAILTMSIVLTLKR